MQDDPPGQWYITSTNINHLIGQTSAPLLPHPLLLLILIQDTPEEEYIALTDEFVFDRTGNLICFQFTPYFLIEEVPCSISGFLSKEWGWDKKSGKRKVCQRNTQDAAALLSGYNRMIEPCYWIPQVRLEAVDEIKMFAMQIEFIFFFILLLVFIPLHPRPWVQPRLISRGCNLVPSRVQGNANDWFVNLIKKLRLAIKTEAGFQRMSLEDADNNIINIIFLSTGISGERASGILIIILLLEAKEDPLALDWLIDWVGIPD